MIGRGSAAFFAIFLKRRSIAHVRLFVAKTLVVAMIATVLASMGDRYSVFHAYHEWTKLTRMIRGIVFELVFISVDSWLMPPD